MSKRLTNEQFVTKCGIVHNNKYNYSLVIIMSVTWWIHTSSVLS